MAHPLTAAAPLPPSLSPSRPPLPLASPTKRSYRSSPTSSPDPADDAAHGNNSRVLRTRLSNVNDGGGGVEHEEHIRRVEINLDGVGKGAFERDEDACGTPNTPPEEPVELLVGLGVQIKPDDGRGCTAPFDEEGEGATQTATAERQTQELREVSNDMYNQLARLCSQHWMSDYNTLKRAVAAAAYETQHPPAPSAAAAPVPSYPPIPRVPSFPSSAASSAGARPTLPPRSSSERKATTSAVTPAKKTDVAAPVAAASSSLTPAMSSFAFNPTPSTSTPSTPSSRSSTAAGTANRPVSAEAVDGLLSDLVHGEPVSVQRTSGSNVVVVSESVLKPAAVAPTPPPQPSVPGLLPGMIVMNGVAVKTSVSHPINISPLVPPELLAVLSSRLFGSSSSSPAPPSSSTASPFFLRPSPSTDLLSLCASLACFPPSSSTTSAPPAATAAPPQLGNFLLSSCPGKKVRLSPSDHLPRTSTSGGANTTSSGAPRGAICRDVALDLARARDTHNVALVVCCLDDAELAYLGVPWPVYSSAARELGLEVVRMPMVEGFAPESAHFLDERLERIVREYTLKGKSVLAHCRGGIGRAGLVASCWMLKMGLVDGLGEGVGGGEGTMRVVERTVELIRKRRSVKAIETAHQVHFLVQYVAYLQAQGRAVEAGQLVAA
ncbi:hypothetical protein JCM6882_004833 [Rhodosporidiobolus microsporus]